MTHLTNHGNQWITDERREMMRDDLQRVQELRDECQRAHSSCSPSLCRSTDASRDDPSRAK